MHGEILTVPGGHDRLYKPVREAGLIVALSCAIAATASLTPLGLPAQTDLVRRARLTDAVLSLPTIEVAQAIRQQHIVFIDARPTGDYQAGSIPGAINLPAAADGPFRRMTLAHVPPNATLVVFCSSRDCSLDRLLARGLIEDGFTDVRRLDGGYEAWLAGTR
jgi:rhodanese-related sulfurtransferase